MGKLCLLWIVLGLLSLVLGLVVYMDLVVKSPISEPVVMLCFGICLVVASQLRFSKENQ